MRPVIIDIYDLQRDLDDLYEGHGFGDEGHDVEDHVTVFLVGADLVSVDASLGPDDPGVSDDGEVETGRGQEPEAQRAQRVLVVLLVHVHALADVTDERALRNLLHQAIEQLRADLLTRNTPQQDPRQS